MKKRINILFLIIIGLISFSSFNVCAKETYSFNITEQEKLSVAAINDYALIADNKNENTTTDTTTTDELKCEGLLGNPDNEDSVAWLIAKILNYLRLLGPLMILILSSLEFLKAVLTSDDESLKKAEKNLITRLILAAALFVLPTLIQVLLDIFGLTSSDVCIFDWNGGIR